MIVSTPAFDWIRASPTNLATTGGFGSLGPQADDITDDAGAFKWVDQWTDPAAGNVHFAPNAALILLYGTGADNSTFNARLTGYSKFGNMWIPTKIFEVACTLSVVIGQTGQEIDANQRFADTITKTSGPSNMEVSSPADNSGPGYILVDGLGFSFLKLTIGTGTATDGNALIKRL